MKKLMISLCLLGALQAGASLRALPFPVAYAGARSPYEAGVDLARPERERIQAHLARVEADLRANPPAGLSEAQRAARAARLDDLHAYWTRGEFPLNRDFPDRLTPYFIDADGVPCAMGHLVIASGHAAFAEEVRKNRNNAYIPEIAAADGRLAAWAEANGMTLEEAARVQPAYGPPRLSAVTRMAVDSLGRPWAFGPDQNNIMGSALFRREGTVWVNQPATGTFLYGFCVTRSGIPAFIGPAIRWKDKNYSSGTGEASYPVACAWDPAQKSLWVGMTEGLRRFTRGGALDTLAVRAYSTTLASDTVLSVAATGSAAWAGTTRGLSRRGLLGADTLVTTWDSTALRGWRVTGLREAGGDKVWAGLEGQKFPPNTQAFSTRGLRRWDGSQWRIYLASMSSVYLPGDTIFALAMRDTASAWIATKTGFYAFSGAASTPKVADIPSSATVFDLVNDGAGGFYAGTNLGVYHFSNGALTFLGQPAVGLHPGVAGQGPGRSRGLRVMTRAEAARAAEVGRLRSIQGRQVPMEAAQGVYLPEAATVR